MRRAHALCYVPVRRVRQEELPLSSQSSADVFLSIDVLLAAVHHPNVPWTNKRDLPDAEPEAFSSRRENKH